MGALNDEKKLQVDEKNNKNWKVWKIFENVIIIKFTFICYKVTASGNIVHSILNYKCMRLVSILQ